MFGVKIKIKKNLPFFGSILNFFRPIDICLSLLECLQSSCESRVSISVTTSHNSSFICCNKKRNRFFINKIQIFRYLNFYEFNKIELTIVTSLFLLRFQSDFDINLFLQFGHTLGDSRL